MKQAKADYITQDLIYQATYNNLNSDEPLSPFGEQGIEVARIIEEKRVHPDFAGWLIGLEPNAPDHQGIIQASEHFLYNCQEP